MPLHAGNELTDDHCMSGSFTITGSNAATVLNVNGSTIFGSTTQNIHQVSGTVDLSGSICNTTADTVGTYVTAAETTNSAININSLVTFIDDSNAPHSGERLFLTLATGARVGQLKIITMTGAKSGADNPRLTKSDGNLATNIGTNGITWSGVGDSVTLVYNGSTWAIAGRYGISIA